jgi:Transmembrane domain of unknown function (DUF3566)
VSGAPLRFTEHTGVLDAPTSSAGAPVVAPAAPPTTAAPAVPAAAPTRRTQATPAAAATRLTRRERKSMRRLRARKVRRIVRHVDPWSVLKLALLFYICLYVVFLVAGLLLWNLATRAGVIDNVESFIEDMGAFESFEFEPKVIFQATALGGAVFTVMATGLTALGAVLFNLISDLVGGVRFTVIEEDSARPIVPDRPKRSKKQASSSAG